MRELGIILVIFALNHHIQATIQKPEACYLKQDGGEGEKSDVTVYMHYDDEKDNCFPFQYTGHGGNANRFLTEKQCMRNCSQRAEELFPKDERQACMLPRLAGECQGTYRRFYYSLEDKECKSFTWTGCVGNGNRFFTLALCNMTCFKAAEEFAGQTGPSVGLILGVVFGLIGAVILIVVIVIAVRKKPSSKKRGKKDAKDAKSVEQPLKVQTIEMGEGEAQPATLDISASQT